MLYLDETISAENPSEVAKYQNNNNNDDDNDDNDNDNNNKMALNPPYLLFSLLFFSFTFSLYSCLVERKISVLFESADKHIFMCTRENRWFWNVILNKSRSLLFPACRASLTRPAIWPMKLMYDT